MKHFFITGLPRTRTGWLSVLFSYGPSICIHEATRFVGKEGGPMEFLYLARKEYHDFEYVGNSDSGILSRMPSLTKNFPNSPVVFIRRPIEEVQESLVRAGIVKKQDWGLIVGTFMQRRAHDFLKNNPSALVVDYNDLDNLQTIKRLWHHLLPGIKFPEHRWEYLKGMHVDMHQPEYTKLLPEEYKEVMK